MKQHPLKEHMKARGLKLGWLAAQIHIGQSTLTKYMTGDLPTPMPIKLAIELILGGTFTRNDWPDK
jgi:hypothetical protein